MLNPINFASLKNVMFKYFKHKRVLIEIRGTLQTRLFIEDAKICLNRCKMVIFNDTTDFSIDFGELKKLKTQDKYHVELVYENFTIEIEV